MARRLKKRPVGETEQNTWVTFAEVAHDPFPRDPERLRQIVGALLTRFTNRISSKETLFLLSNIRRLAGVERRFPLHTPQEYVAASSQRQGIMREADTIATDLIQSATEEVLYSIGHEVVPGSTHANDTIYFQRDLLTEFLKVHPYPKLRTTRDSAVKGWVQRHASQVWDVLSVLPCYCIYRKSFQRILDEDDLTNCLGPADLIHLVLAELHYSSPSAIRKILSHPR